MLTEHVPSAAVVHVETGGVPVKTAPALLERRLNVTVEPRGAATKPDPESC
jgi:hypothetical protein